MLLSMFVCVYAANISTKPKYTIDIVDSRRNDFTDEREYGKKTRKKALVKLGLISSRICNSLYNWIFLFNNKIHMLGKMKQQQQQILNVNRENVQH